MSRDLNEIPVMMPVEVLTCGTGLRCLKTCCQRKTTSRAVISISKPKLTEEMVGQAIKLKSVFPPPAVAPLMAEHGLPMGSRLVESHR